MRVTYSTFFEHTHTEDFRHTYTHTRTAMDGSFTLAAQTIEDSALNKTTHMEGEFKVKAFLVKPFDRTQQAPSGKYVWLSRDGGIEYYNIELRNVENPEIKAWIKVGKKGKATSSNAYGKDYFAEKGARMLRVLLSVMFDRAGDDLNTVGVWDQLSKEKTLDDWSSGNWGAPFFATFETRNSFSEMISASSITRNIRINLVPPVIKGRQSDAQPDEKRQRKE